MSKGGLIATSTMPYKPTPLLLFSIFLVALCNSNLAAQTYTIHFAEKQPAWVFPLWFTNGDGQKDTFYLAYDLEASSATEDSLFGEYPSSSDESLFYVETDFKWKVIATDKLTYAIGISISNIVYPFTIAYDSKVLYSDSLPGPPSGLVPKVWASFVGSGFIEDCPTIDFDGFSVALTDTIIDGYPVSPTSDETCTRDTLVVVQILTGPTAISLAEWDPPTSLPNQTNLIPEEINAWFEGNSLAIAVNSSENSKLRLFNLSGVLLFERDLPAGNYLVREDLKKALHNTYAFFLLSIVNSNLSFTKK